MERECHGDAVSEIFLLGERQSPHWSSVLIPEREKKIFQLPRIRREKSESQIQWNLRTRDTLGLIILSLIERLSLSQR